MNSAFQRGQGVVAWRQIADSLEAEVATGILSPGERLPTEAQLADRFGVNRHTVRRGLAALAERGLVRAAQGSGTFVEAKPLRYPIGPRTRFSEIANAAGREAWGRLIGAETLPADPWVAEALRLAPATAVLALHSQHEADGVPISTGRTMLPLPRFAGFDRHYAESGSITRSFANCGVSDYLRHSTEITARLAEPAEAALLAVAHGRAVLVISSVNVDVDGVPIQAARTCFAADRVTLSV